MRHPNIFELNEFLLRHKAFKHFHDSVLKRNDLINLPDSDTHTSWLISFSQDNQEATLTMITNTSKDGPLTFKATLNKQSSEVIHLESELISLVRMAGNKFIDETDFNHFVCTGYNELPDTQKIEALKNAILLAKQELYYGQGPYSD